MTHDKNSISTKDGFSICADIALAGLMACFSLANQAKADTATWPQWRGVAQNGVAAAGQYPRQWNGEDNQGIVWKVDLPGRGGSTPVVAGNTAFITAGVDDTNQVMAIDLDSGELRWKVEAGTDQGNKHAKGSGSNPSAVTDGSHVFAYFRSGDLVCVDKAGNKVWQQNLQDMYGKDTLWWDLGSSPVITPDSVIVTVMHSNETEDRRETKSVGYLVSFDKQSGKVKWKVDRNTDAPVEASQSYSTPVLVTLGGESMLAVLGADHATLHRVADGKMVGDVGGFNPAAEMYFRSISSPASDQGILICPYSRGETVTAINLKKMAAGAGRSSVQWERDDMGSDVPTPAVSEGTAYFVEDGKQRQGRGTVSAVDVQTGNVRWEVTTPRSRTGFTSSPLLAGDHLYVTSEDGTTYVIGPVSQEQPGIVATNRIAKEDGITVASPVPVEGGLLLRTRHSLYRVGNTP